LSTQRLQRLAIAGLLVVGWFLASGAARLLVVRAPVEHADAILVLSGSSRLAERNHLAAELFRQGRAPRVILTNDYVQVGWDSKEERNPFSYEFARRILQTDGVPAERIEVLMQSVNGKYGGTYGELELVRRYASQQQLRSLLLVTSAYHSRRTLWTANNLFKGTGVLIGLERASPTPSPWIWWLLPDGWRLVAGEYLKMLYYWPRFWSSP